MDNQTPQAPSAALDTLAGPARPAAKKKASWTRTILWMLSMVLLLNVVMALIAYTLHHYQVI